MSTSQALAILWIWIVFCPESLVVNTEEPAAKSKPPRVPDRAWYYLKPMKEPRLDLNTAKAPSRTAYRFLWCPSFHDQVSVRLEKANENIVFHVVRLSLEEGSKPGKIVSTSKRKVSQAFWDRVVKQVEKAGFWSMPEFEPVKPGDRTIDILDGDSLTVEGKKDGKYHWVHRRNPEPGDFVDLCRMMLFATGTEFRTIWLDYRR
jgi:hypothetical protein